MNENSICKNCKKLVNDHSNEELFLCKLEIAKMDTITRTEEEIIDDFNKIKGGEFHRMSES